MTIPTPPTRLAKASTTRPLFTARRNVLRHTAVTTNNMARVRNPPGSQVSAAIAPMGGRQVLKEKTNTARAKAPVYPDDGDTEGLVKVAKKKRGRPKKAQQNDDELVMAGGLGMASDPAAVQPTSEAPMTTDELARSDDAPAKANRRPARTVRKVAQSEVQNKVLQGLKERMEATARNKQSKQTKAAMPTSDAPASMPSPDTIVVKPAAARKSQESVTERSGSSLSPSPPAPGKLSVAKGNRISIAQPGSVMKVQSTPLVESSMLALKHFKRRPRQPSMLQMVKQRTASARPSLANITTVGDDAVEGSSVFDLDFDGGDDEDDFAPEAEGTPLNAARAKQRSTSGITQASSAKPTVHGRSSLDTFGKRKSDQIDVSSGSLSALRAKRRKTVGETTNSFQQDAPPFDDDIIVRTSTERAQTPPIAPASDVQVANSPATSTPPTDPFSSPAMQPAENDGDIIPSTERENDVVPGADDEEDDRLSGTLADPVSSSPAPVTTSIRGLDEALRPPATQASPEPTQKKPRAKTKPMNTAVLQSMLPKKRQPLKPRKRKSDYDLESDTEEGEMDASHLEDDEDELGGRLRRTTVKAPSRGRKLTTQKRGRPRKSTTVTAKKVSTGANRTSTTSAVAKLRTYGRQADSDKENDGSDFEEPEDSTLPEVSISMQEASKSKELEAAKAKFASIDEWDMEFESMSAEDHRSSSQSWR